MDDKIDKVELIEYCNTLEDFYIEEGDIENKFYNAALSDIKYFLIGKFSISDDYEFDLSNPIEKEKYNIIKRMIN